MLRIEDLANALSNILLDFGSNSNGYWMKFGNGLMLCWNYGTVNDWAINNAYGSLYQGTRTFSFPQTFSEAPMAIPGGAKWGSGASWATMSANPTTTQMTIRAIDTSSRATGTDVTYSWLAIGRWK